jgi:hypothetical protein
MKGVKIQTNSETTRLIKTTQTKSVKNQTSSKITRIDQEQPGWSASRIMHVQKQLGPAYKQLDTTPLSSGACQLPRLNCFDSGATLGGSDSRAKDQEYKHSRLQQPHDNTSRPFIWVLFWRKEPEEGSGAAGYIPSKKTFKLFLQKTLRLFVPNIKRLGATLSECNFRNSCSHLRERTQSNQED